jgi:hypothetical protein
MSLEQTFPPRGRNCKHRPKSRRPTEKERQAALDRAGVLNLGDPTGPEPTAQNLKNDAHLNYDRKRPNITEL